MSRRSCIVLILLGLAALVSASCEREPTDEESVSLIRAHIARGPVAACCDWVAVRRPNCEADAPTNCGCVNQARIVSSKVTAPVAQERTVRAVYLEIEGPSGKGSCQHNIYRGAIHEGWCACAR